MPPYEVGNSQQTSYQEGQGHGSAVNVFHLRVLVCQSSLALHQLTQNTVYWLVKDCVWLRWSEAVSGLLGPLDYFSVAVPQKLFQALDIADAEKEN